MKFAREQTNIIKGLAICLMLIHHLYGFPDRMLHGNYYISVFPFYNLEYYIGQLGSICVSMFLFLSGYGMFLGYQRSGQSSHNYSWQKLKSFYFTYWLYFAIFVPIGLIFFPNVTLWNSTEPRYSTSLSVFIQNLIGWSSTYNQEWWFVSMFAFCLIVLVPIYLKLAQNKILLLIFLSIFLFVASSQLNIYGHLGFTFWQASLCLGFICARFNCFSSSWIQLLDRLRLIWLLPVIVMCLMIRVKLGLKADFLVVFPLIYFTIRATSKIHVSQVLAYFGQYSFPIWLIHSFFCYYFFQDLIYLPKWSFLIFLWLMAISLLSIIILENFVFPYLKALYQKLKVLFL